MPTLEELAADVENVKNHVPTLDELVRDLGIQSWNESGAWTGGVTVTLFTAMTACRIRAVSLVTEYGTVPASDSDYWTMTLRKGLPSNGWSTIAVRSTRSTGSTANGGILPRQPWTFDAAVFANALLAPGELGQLVLAKTGNPAAIDLPALVSTAYVPA